ncbi:MAG: long-chain fatty acid--CoA ligase [Bacteroidetes bacterium GWF2_42_66]|nr:MAG: long-chain fatty acid--CoA ligase [Bacteroidetes bacterium GWA2_42_15]OFX98422.1 MAG: long-chain fatty acid--CoA ligase [Bacteroidetes bacterium GWE2_42_39]OFY42807.1 MAG: long-chain fatty acid--CoA ligase [Bacteroidetes bacterium GWF2_42_66]HBL74430.1 long-chain fatty acid--CoA ligase [Prolixibacteraceae bacterium]HCR90947.1 long-chain fatty acid--CoA ligase [Prolixibacteraceae bacterium]
MDNQKLIALFAGSFRQNWELPLFSDFRGGTYTYGEAAQIIRNIHCFFRESGIGKGDKVALFGRNASNWGISFIAVVSYGAVAVPVLPDFNPDDVHHIINHSEAKILFGNDLLLEKIESGKIPEIQAIVSLVDFRLLFARSENLKENAEKCFKTDFAGKVNPQNFELEEQENEKLCIISYTSGTSGFTKGVMLPVRSILSNLVYAREHMPLKAGDKIVSFLPMAHVFGLLFEFLFPVTTGCHITFLTKAPTPQVITQAFAEVRPRLILSVPLVIEKIYRKRVQPTLDKPVMKILMAIPGISSVLRKKVKAKLTETFGGTFFEIVIGGAPLSRDVEVFFRKIKFPFTIGYGMTECGPLISYDAWKTTQPSSAGKLVDRMEVKIDSEDPYNVVGEIMVKGENVMMGYYKNEEATRAAIDADGWLHTGDLGVIDESNYIFIRGRSKNMLLGPSGQNIYPEELEDKLTTQPYVAECVVIERERKLVALVYPDKESVQSASLTEEQLMTIMNENRHRVNKELPRYEHISRIELVDQEFEKTPKKNIKRFLYT